MEYPIDPKVTGAQIEAARLAAEDASLTNEERIKANMLWIDLDSRLRVEKPLWWARVMFRWLTRCLIAYALVMILLCILFHVGTGANIWQRYGLTYVVIAAVAKIMNGVVQGRINRLAHQLDEDIPSTASH